MKNIIRDLRIGPNAVQIGVVSFSDNVQPVFQLNTYQNKEAMIRHVDRMVYLDQSTNTQEAIRYMRTVMFTPQNGDRPGAPNSAIIITDGVPQLPSNLNEARRLAVQEAQVARSQGINVFAIGVGPQITQEVLNSIANRPPSQFTFKVEQFRELETILTQVASAACGAVVNTPCKICFTFLISSIV